MPDVCLLMNITLDVDPSPATCHASCHMSVMLEAITNCDFFMDDVCSAKILETATGNEGVWSVL